MYIMRMLAGVLLATLLAACGGGGGSPGQTTGSSGAGNQPAAVALFTTAPGELTLAANSSQDFSIGGGTAPYTAVTNNAAIATATITGATLTIHGVAVGSAQISVHDAAGTAVSVGVTVNTGTVRPLFTNAPSSLTIAAGSAGTQSFAVGGGASPYTATSSNASVVSASITNGTLTVTGLSGGTASVLIMDSLGSTLTIPVTVPPAPNMALFTTAPSSVVVAIGSAPAYSIGGGTGPYTATSNNTSVANAAVVGNTLVISGVSAGLASVVVRDSAGVTVPVNVTVPTAGSVQLYTTAPADVTVAIGASTAYAVGGGASPYTAASGNTGIATVTLSGTTLTVNGIAAGSTTVLVRDAAGATVNLRVTVSAPNTVPLFTTAPSAVTIAVGASPVYAIGGGTGPYTATSNNVSVVKVSVTGTAMTVTGVAPGQASIVIRDNAGGTPVNVDVTIAPAQLQVNPNDMKALIGDTLVATISGGRAPYRAVVSNTLVADAAVNGSTLTVTVKQAAQSVAIVLFDADGASTSFKLTAAAGGTSIQLSPVALTISECMRPSDTFSLKVYGAAPGSITAFSSDTNLLQVSPQTDNTVLVANQRFPIDSDKIVTITVVDSTGATATSAVTIQNSIAACPP